MVMPHVVLANDLQAKETVVVRASGRLFGDVQAANLVVEAGAVLVGQFRIGRPATG